LSGGDDDDDNNNIFNTSPIPSLRHQIDTRIDEIRKRVDD